MNVTYLRGVEGLCWGIYGGIIGVVIGLEKNEENAMFWRFCCEFGKGKFLYKDS